MRSAFLHRTTITVRVRIKRIENKRMRPLLLRPSFPPLDCFHLVRGVTFGNEPAEAGKQGPNEEQEIKRRQQKERTRGVDAILTVPRRPRRMQRRTTDIRRPRVMATGRFVVSREMRRKAQEAPRSYPIRIERHCVLGSGSPSHLSPLWQSGRWRGGDLLSTVRSAKGERWEVLPLPS